MAIARALDHLVLVVADVDVTLAWYGRVAGLGGVRVDDWRNGEAPFPSLRVDEGTIIDLLQADRTGHNVDHVCLVIEPTDLEAVKQSGHFEVISGPDRRFGARGDGTSLYVLDPDGNTVELRHYA